LGINRTHLLERRHEIHTLVAAHFSPYRTALRPSHRSRRTVSERRRERAQARQSERPTTSKGQPSPRPRNLGQ
jgi:hypothetical protein